MNANDLVLFATNTGKLYPRHLSLAKAGATLKGWENHVKTLVLPEYRFELREPYEGLSLVAIEQVAKELSDYYAEHVKEE